MNQILDELFPVHANFVDAQRLLSPPRLETVASQCSNNRSYRTTGSMNQRARRPSLTAPLRSIQVAQPAQDIDAEQASNSKPAGTCENVSKDQCNHIRTIWEDKFRRNQLTVEDSFYLVLRDDLMNVLENASLLRETQLTYAQAMEIEVTLDNLRHSQAVNCRRLPDFKRVPVCVLLANNVLKHGKAFKSKGLRVVNCKDPLSLEKTSILRASLEPPKLLLGAVKPSSTELMHRSPAHPATKTRPSTISYGQICRQKERCSSRTESEILSPRIQVIESDHSRGKHDSRYISRWLPRFLRTLVCCLIALLS